LYKKKIEKQALEFYKAKAFEVLGSTKDVPLNKTISEIAEYVSDIVECVVDVSHDRCKKEKCLTAKGRHAFDGSQKIFEKSPTLAKKILEKINEINKNRGETMPKKLSEKKKAEKNK